MSNAQRPSLQRQHTRSTKAKAAEALDRGYQLTVDGEVFEARLGDVTPEIARELRRHLGVGFMSLLDQMSTDPDIDLISAAVWVARRIRGEWVAFEDVSVGYDAILADGFNVAEPGAEQVDDAGPEG